jgi:hypothetical protein
MTIMHGSLDPVVVLANIKNLIQSNPQAHLVSIIAGHEVMGRYVPAVVKEIVKSLD